jgi:signal transduction histidine kinase
LDAELLRETRTVDDNRRRDDDLRAERRLVRFGLDLHDGPLQDVVGIGMELSLLTANLKSALPKLESGERIFGQLEDIQARLLALQNDLRELTYATDIPSLGLKPFRAAIAEHLEELERTSDLEAEAHIDGDFDQLTASQRIALLRIVEEAFTNARTHSGARRITVAMFADEDHVEAVIVDDGRGFDVESALSRAARRGRLGLLGMAERVRMLGGQFDIESKPGETKVSVRLLRYDPDLDV